MSIARTVLSGLALIGMLTACGGPTAVEEAPPGGASTWFVELEGEGGVWLGPRDLAAMGVDPAGVSAPVLQLAWGDRAIPYLSQRTGAGWGVFFFAPDRSTRTSQRTAVRVDLGVSGPEMLSEEPGPPRDTPCVGAWVTRTWEEDQRYVPQAETETPWFWQPLRTPSSGGVTQTVALPGALSGPVTMTLHLWSHTASAANPDHRLHLTWDRHPVDAWEWDGQGMQHLTTSFPVSVQGTYALGLRTSELPGAELGLVWLDGWDVTYRRPVVADGSVYQAPGNTMRVDEAQSGARVVDVSDVFAPQDLGVVARGETIATVPGHRYWVGVPDDARSPLAVRAARSVDIDALEAVSFLAVAPRPFHAPLDELLELRRTQGLEVAVVDPQAIYDTVGVGQLEAQALRGLVGRLPSLQYLLLVGDATADPEGYEGDAGSLRVVTPFTRTTTLGETPADGLLGVDDEGTPRVAVGRFPATSVDEVEAMVAKTMAWEREGQPPRPLLVSDDEAEFGELAETIGDLLPPGAKPERLDAGQEGSRADLMEMLQQGPTWLNYTGHGSLTLLCDEKLLTREDGARWSEPALVVAWTCLAAHYAHPTQDSIGEAWLRTREGGAVAFLGPVGETSTREQRPFLQAFYSALDERGRLGDAWLAALQEGWSEDVRWGYVLLGDPALRLHLE